jgi:cytochrome d ubiquinol oxidase subunit II
MILYELIDSYDILRVIWWALLGVLLIGFALTDGFDMGSARSCPSWADRHRTPHGHQHRRPRLGRQPGVVHPWAAAPSSPPGRRSTRSASRASTLRCSWCWRRFIVRPVAFKYRSKRDSRPGGAAWDWALFAGGAVPALIFGVAVGNVLQGVPFHLTDTLYADV